MTLATRIKRRKRRKEMGIKVTQPRKNKKVMTHCRSSRTFRRENEITRAPTKISKILVLIYYREPELSRKGEIY